MDTNLSRLLVGLSVQISRSDGEFFMYMYIYHFVIYCIPNLNRKLESDFLVRYSGRVHSAIVKSVDAVKSTAMVEWQERKICRGKEVSDFIQQKKVIGKETYASLRSSLK